MALKTVRRGRVYRFNKYIAFDADETHTQYLDVEQARAFAALLLKYAADIEANDKSSKSTLQVEEF